MAQHDYVIANGTGAAVRSDLNSALAAIVSNNSGATTPATTYAYQWWADTTTGTLKLRNSANSAWIELMQLDGTLTMEDGTEALPGLSFRSDLDTGLWRPGANQLAISTNAVERVEFGASEVVFNDSGANYDFRVEGDTNANLLFVDASADAVGIGTSSPGDLVTISDSTTPKLGLRTGTTQRGEFRATSAITSLVSYNSSPMSFIINDGTDKTAIHIDGSQRVGIGTASPSQLLHLSKSTNADTYIQSTNSLTNSYYGTAGDGRTLTWNSGAYPLVFGTADTERARIDSSGRLLLGTSSDSSSGRVVIEGSPAASGVQGVLVLKRASNNPASGTQALGAIDFKDLSNGHGASITALSDGSWSTPSDCPTALTFSTTADGASSPTERARITSAGFFKASNSGSYHSSTGEYHEFRQTISNSASLVATASDSSYVGNLIHASATRSATNAYSLLKLESGAFTDAEFNFAGNGNAFADGTFTGGGADYAEYFEWSDSNPEEEDRRGISVVLDDEKIRKAVAGEDPIGVISGNPSIVGDAAWNKWSGKYLRDEFGSYLLDAEGYRQLNPAYDPDVEYIPREQRPEWGCVGLMGKLRIRKGQVTGSRWIKMRDISDTVEEWLVR